jgi:hypothetical protein
LADDLPTEYYEETAVEVEVEPVEEVLAPAAVAAAVDDLPPAAAVDDVPTAATVDEMYRPPPQ